MVSAMLGRFDENARDPPNPTRIETIAPEQTSVMAPSKANRLLDT
jgi:hypothetical protein